MLATKKIKMPCFQLFLYLLKYVSLNIQVICYSTFQVTFKYSAWSHKLPRHSCRKVAYIVFNYDGLSLVKLLMTLGILLNGGSNLVSSQSQQKKLVNKTIFC